VAIQDHCEWSIDFVPKRAAQTRAFDRQGYFLSNAAKSSAHHDRQTAGEPVAVLEAPRASGVSWAACNACFSG
jgi:hypothetical protein